MKSENPALFMVTGFLAVLFFILGCGQDICILGLGECNYPYDPIIVSGELTIKASGATVEEGGQLTIIAKGGRLPYEFTIEDGSGDLSDDEDNERIYTASDDKGRVIIRVTDANDNIAEISIVVVDKQD